MYYVCSTHSSADRHLGRFHFLALVDTAALNMCVQLAVWQDTQSSGDMPRSSLVGS